MKIEKLNAGNLSALKEAMTHRTPFAFPKEEAAVREILENIRKEGDRALLDYTKRFDGADLTAEGLRITREEFEDAYRIVGEELTAILRRAAERIRVFHEREAEKSWFMTEENGSLLGQRVLPMDRVGVYVPGGRASYPSSVLMNVIPAKVAGVKEIVMTTPCGKDGRVSPVTLVAADIAGVTEAYRVGGAQAIGALAYGTETIRKTDKITGPGNIYVALAKRQVYGAVSIDSVAGPSEILVLCDETAKPECVAADLLSQAEHDPLAAAICVTTDEDLAQRIAEEIKAQTARRLRREIIERSLADYGHIFVAETIEDAVEAVNEIASEHLEVVTKEPFALLPKIRHAGAVFLGPHSSEPLGDYMAGPNHILPTCGTARFFSPLSVHDFVKRSSVIYFTEDALSALEKDIRAFAKSEGLTAHAAAIAVRFGEEESDI